MHRKYRRFVSLFLRELFLCLLLFASKFSFPLLPLLLLFLLPPSRPISSAEKVGPQGWTGYDLSHVKCPLVANFPLPPSLTLSLSFSHSLLAIPITDTSNELAATHIQRFTMHFPLQEFNIVGIPVKSIALDLDKIRTVNVPAVIR